MASARISEDAAKLLRATDYSAIPITNAHSNGMLMKHDRQSFLHRTVPMRTALLLALLLAIFCGLIGRESVKWSYNYTTRNLSQLTNKFTNRKHGRGDVPKKPSMTVGLFTRKGTTYLTDPSGTKSINRPDGTQIVVTMYNVPEEDISPGDSIMAAGACPKGKKVSSCFCTSTVRDCLVAGQGKEDSSANGCLCGYTGASSECDHSHPGHHDHHDHHDHPHSKQARVFVISSCVAQ